MQAVRALRQALGTLLAGVLVGYVIMALVGSILQGSTLLGGTGESPEANAYMIGLLKQDPDALTALRPKRDVVSRAVELLTTERTSGAWQPSSLTFLGGGGIGALRVQIYVVGIRSIDGEDRMIPFSLTLAAGKVVRIE